MTMMMLAARRVCSRQLAVRQYSRSIPKKEPKLHNADGKWAELKAKRPIDADDTHVSVFWIPNSVLKRETNFIFVLYLYFTSQLVFHPPFNPGTILLLVGAVVGIGGGSMWYGVVHQQVRMKNSIAWTLHVPLDLLTLRTFSTFCISVQARLLEISCPLYTLKSSRSHGTTGCTLQLYF